MDQGTTTEGAVVEGDVGGGRVLQGERVDVDSQPTLGGQVEHGTGVDEIGSLEREHLGVARQTAEPGAPQGAAGGADHGEGA